MCVASRIVNVTSTEMLLTWNDSLSLNCVGDQSLVWLHQQRRINVSQTSAALIGTLQRSVTCTYVSIMFTNTRSWDIPHDDWNHPAGRQRTRPTWTNQIVWDIGLTSVELLRIGQLVGRYDPQPIMRSSEWVNKRTELAENECTTYWTASRRRRTWPQHLAQRLAEIMYEGFAEIKLTTMLFVRLSLVRGRWCGYHGRIYINFVINLMTFFIAALWHTDNEPR